MSEPVSARSEIARYLGGFRASQLAVLWAEDWLGWLVRSLPGAVGFGLRWLLYKLLFKRLDGVAFVYPGARMTHVYGIAAGANFRINTGAFIDARGGLTIGANVLVGPNAVIVTSQHQWADPGQPIVTQGHESAPVEIGDDVWIGGNAVITPGVRIGRGSVVGAGAVVTGPVEPYSIVVGVPARPISTRPHTTIE